MADKKIQLQSSDGLHNLYPIGCMAVTKLWSGISYSGTITLPDSMDNYSLLCVNHQYDSLSGCLFPWCFTVEQLKEGTLYVGDSSSYVALTRTSATTISISRGGNTGYIKNIWGIK